MTARRLLLIWAGLLALVALELAMALLHVGWIAPLLAVVMMAVVMLGPMELPGAPNAARIFAAAGLFWLVVNLFGLGSLDPLTRHAPPSWWSGETARPTRTDLSTR